MILLSLKVVIVNEVELLRKFFFKLRSEVFSSAILWLKLVRSPRRLI